MSLTTSEEIQKQLSVILAFHGNLDIEVGDVLGIGKLSESHIEVLISRSLHFLRSFNALLRDYLGAELYSIEFELKSLNKKGDELRILPQSMLFVLGEYKDCTTLMLLLSKELKLLDPHKTRSDIDELGARFFEIEEGLNREELSDYDRKALLSRFAKRFAYYLQGKAIENKWNKRLIGLTDNDEGASGGALSYLSVSFYHRINWAMNKLMEISGFRTRNDTIRLTPDQRDLFMNFRILPRPAYRLIHYSSLLGSSLLEIMNSSSVDDLHHIFLLFILSSFSVYKKVRDESSLDAFSNMRLFHRYLDNVKTLMGDFKDHFDSNCKQGYKGSVDKVLYLVFRDIVSGSSFERHIHEGIVKISRDLIREGIVDKTATVRSHEWLGVSEYIYRTSLLVIDKIRHSLPGYFIYVSFLDLSKQVVTSIYKDFEGQKRPVRALGLKYLSKFSAALRNRIMGITLYGIVDDSSLPFFNDEGAKKGTGSSRSSSKSDGGSISSNTSNSSRSPIDVLLSHFSSLNVDDSLSRDVVEKVSEEVLNQFKGLSNIIIDEFVKNVRITVTDLLGFVEIMLEDLPKAKDVIKRLSVFESEVHFLSDFLVRHSTLQSFLQSYRSDRYPFELPSVEDFINEFLVFVQKRLGGFHLVWKDHVLEWICLFPRYYNGVLDRHKEAHPDEKVHCWDFMINEFISYIEKRSEEETDIEGFKEPLKKYVQSLAMNFENRFLMEIYKTYEMSLEFLEQIPDFIIQTYKQSVSRLTSVGFLNLFSHFPGSVPSFSEAMKDEEGYMDFDSFPLYNSSSTGDQSLTDFLKKFVEVSFYKYLLKKEFVYFGSLVARPRKIVLRGLKDYSIKYFDGKDLFHFVEFRYFKNMSKVKITSNFSNILPRF